MNKRKRYLQQSLRIAKYIPWIALLVITIPSMYLGQGESLRNASNFVSSEKNYPLSSSQQNIRNLNKCPSPRTADVINQTTQENCSSFSRVKKESSLLLLLNHVVIIVLYLLVLGFLNNQPIVKQGLLLYLYKDLVCIGIVLHCLWVLVRLIPYSSVDWQGMYEFQAKAISFAIYFMRFQGLVFLNLVAILKMYMIKKAIINPPMPWGDDEDLGIKLIRLITFVTAFVLTTTIYVFEMYPNFYYSLLTGYTNVVTNLPKGALVSMAPLLFLLITLVVTYLATIYYKYTLQHNLDMGIPPQMIYGGVLLILTHCFVDLIFPAFGISFTKYLFATYSVTTLVIQIFIILKNHQLRSFVMSYLTFDILHINVRFVCLCLSIYVFVGLCVY